MKVVMLGADRSVKGGVSAVVNNLYEAGLDQRIDLTYIGTMVDCEAVKRCSGAVEICHCAAESRHRPSEYGGGCELLPEADFYADRPLVPQKGCDSRARRRFSGLLL